MEQTVRRIRVDGFTDIHVETVPRPVARPGEVLVGTTAVGICGSDLHAAHGRHPFVALPMRPGHEVVGVVREVGDGVDEDWVGRRIVVEPNLVCGVCPQCRSGRYNICRELAVFGCQTAGGMTDAFTIAADRVIAVPDTLDDRRAALIEPAATPVHAVRRAAAALGGEGLTGHTVVVIGAGPIGLFVIMAARAAGAGRIVAVDPMPAKRDLAVRVGADAAVDAADSDPVAAITAAVGGPADVTFDCVAVGATVRTAIAVIDKGGVLLVVGVPGGEVPIDLAAVQDRELSVIGSLMYTRDDVLAAIALLETAPFATDELVTAEFDLADADQAFAAAGSGDQVKVLVRVGART